MDSEIELRHATRKDWNAIAELIYMSTNYWYTSNGKPPIFSGEPSSTRLFCEVYEAMDPEHCIIAEDKTMGSIVGSCFYHPRDTHVSLGIMNAHPNYAGKGIARRLLNHILKFAKDRQQDVRLVSSAMNLDSFSLYNKAGFVPYAIFQDMILEIPETGVPEVTPKGKKLRDATLEDISTMVSLEEQTTGIKRGSDFKFFIKNEAEYWHTSVIEGSNGEIDGFLSSIQHPGSRLLGPGCMKTDDDAIALIRRELNVRKGHTMVCLIPSDRPRVIESMYALNAKNCEIHFAQSTGSIPQVDGIFMPTFMPETA